MHCTIGAGILSLSAWPHWWVRGSRHSRHGVPHELHGVGLARERVRQGHRDLEAHGRDEDGLRPPSRGPRKVRRPGLPADHEDGPLRDRLLRHGPRRPPERGRQAVERADGQVVAAERDQHKVRRQRLPGRRAGVGDVNRHQHGGGGRGLRRREPHARHGARRRPRPRACAPERSLGRRRSRSPAGRSGPAARSPA